MFKFLHRQPRTPYGTYDYKVTLRERFARFTYKFLIRPTGIALIALMGVGSIYGGYHYAYVLPADAFMVSTEFPKIEAAQYRIIDELATKCETKGVQEPEAAIVLDANKQMSIGPLMFQIKTVQHYIEKFEDRKITRKEAIQIAIDRDTAYALAERIVFDEKNGLTNWANCSKKLNLAPKVEVIKQMLEK